MSATTTRTEPTSNLAFCSFSGHIATAPPSLAISKQEVSSVSERSPGAQQVTLYPCAVFLGAVCVCLGIIDVVANRLARGNRLIAKARLWKRSYPLCSSQGRRVGATNGIPQHCADRVRECRGHAGCVRTRRRRREVRDGRERDAAKVTLDLTTRQMQVGCVSNLTPLSAEQDQLF